MNMIKAIGASGIAITLFTAPVQAQNLQQSISAFDAIDCKPVVEQQLDVHKISTSNIKNIDYFNTLAGGSETGEGNRTYQAAITFHSCSGSLNFALDNGCYVERIFTTGACMNAELPYK